MPPNRVQSIKYERIDDSESASGGNSTTHAELQSHRTSYFNIFTLHLTLSFVSGICFAFLLSKINLFGGHDSYGSGFKTEIESLRPAISLVKTRFSGTLRYKDGDHLYIDLGPQGVRYFGIPTREVDDAWAGLIGNHEGAFSGDILGPDVLHSLHCLNEVRKILDSPHYYNRTLEELNRGRRVHIDHCLNHIRQIIQCHMDLTPVRTVYYEDINVEVGEFDQEHMCRDIGKLHQYMDKHHTATTGSSQKIHDGRVHRLGYPDTEEEMMGWDHREREFD